MKTLKTILEGSLLDDIDNTINGGEIVIIKFIQKFLEENYRGKWTISEKPNKDGLYEVNSNTSVSVKNTSITSLTNDMFVWNSVKSNFYCANCVSLTTLKGAPKVVGGAFYCHNCNSLKNLEGAPEFVEDVFDCTFCKKLESLEGAPKEVGINFNCYNCVSLTSLKGAPKKVGGTFYCFNCRSLKSLEGAPKEVGNFDCTECGKKFTKNDVQKVSKIKINGSIYC